MEIRVASMDDAESLLKIYAPYVLHTAVSFEYDVPSVEEFQNRIRKTLAEYPYFVAVEDGQIVGYTYAGPLGSRMAYKHSAEVSIYIDKNWHGKGIGRLLYRKLEETLLRQNVFTLYACIAATDRANDEHLTDASIRFHEKMGYRLVGRHHLCGYKFEKWYSVVWMEKAIASKSGKPGPFIPFTEI